MEKITEENFKEIFIAGMDAQNIINKKEKEIDELLEQGENLTNAVDKVMQEYEKYDFRSYIVERINCIKFECFMKFYFYYNELEGGFFVEKVELYDSYDMKFIKAIEF
jgi:hypothetical protein